IAWLGENLVVDNLQNSEYLRVSLRYEDPHGLADIVNEDVNAYMSTIVDKERTEKLARRDELDRKYRNYKSDIMEKERSLYNLTQQIGTSDAETARIRYRVEVADLEALMQTRA